MKPAILYLSYTGLLEPLGRSQVLAYLSRLSNSYSLTLITFEKRIDFQNKTAVEELKLECERFGIDWRPKIYHKSPRVISSIYDLIILFYTCFKLAKLKKANIIHSRGYIPSIAAWFVTKFLYIPFIFDMRALWLEELIEAKRLKRHSLIHRVLCKCEASMLRDASAVVSLTKIAVEYLKNNYNGLIHQKFVVIPTCVDMIKYKPMDEQPKKSEELTFGTMGSVLNSRFRIDWLFKLFSKQYSDVPSTKFKIVTRDNLDKIIEWKESVSLKGADFQLLTSRPQDIVGHIEDFDVAVILFTPGISTLGTSPTRIGEFLACGIPVIVNSRVGDTAELVHQYNVGVVIEDNTNESLELGLLNVRELLKDTSLRARCISVADKVFSADSGAKKYAHLYQLVLNND